MSLVFGKTNTRVYRTALSSLRVYALGRPNLRRKRELTPLPGFACEEIFQCPERGSMGPCFLFLNYPYTVNRIMGKCPRISGLTPQIITTSATSLSRVVEWRAQIRPELVILCFFVVCTRCYIVKSKFAGLWGPGFTEIGGFRLDESA